MTEAELIIANERLEAQIELLDKLIELIEKGD